MIEEQEETPKQIIVADDDPAILRLVKAILEKEGYRVVSAKDGKEAYKLLQSGEAEHLALRVVCLYESIAVKQDGLAGSQDHLHLFVTHFRHQPQRHSCGP